MREFLSNRWTILVLRIVVGATFIYAGSTKIGNPQAFADSIATFQLLGSQFINLLAMALPPFEILVGVMLLMGWRLRSAAFCAIALAVLFALALGQAIGRGLQVDCGCFGSGEPSVFKTWMSLGRDLLLLVAAVTIYAKGLGWISICGNEH